MNWYFNKVGRAEHFAVNIRKKFEEIQGCPKGTAEETAKNQIGEVLETLCSSLIGNPAVRVLASGSAWNESGKARSQTIKVEFETLGEIDE